MMRGESVEAILSDYDLDLNAIEPSAGWRSLFELFTAQAYLRAKSLSFFSRLRCRRQIRQILERHVLRVVSELIAQDNALRQQWADAEAIVWPSEINA